MTEIVWRAKDNRDRFVVAPVKSAPMGGVNKQHGRYGCGYIAHVWRVIVLLALSVSLAVFVAWQHPRQDHFASEHWQVRAILFSELDRLHEWLLVDARSRQIYDKNHILGGILLSEEAWDENLPIFLEHWQPEHPVVIYCDGRASAASKNVALRLLQDLPEARVYVLKGGFPAWKAAHR